MVLEKRIESWLTENIIGVTPGIQVQAHQTGRKVLNISVGKTYPYYDLASLTKVIFTVQVFMKLFEAGKWNFDTRVQDIISWFPHKETRILQLLNHSSGLVWWQPFYEKLIQVDLITDRWDLIKKEIQTLPLDNRKESVYSDVGFLTLGFVMEELYQKKLYEIWQELRNEFFSATTLEFHPYNLPKFSREFYAPTEEKLWRNKLLQGEVNDDNTWALDGVAPQAGLFGSIDDLGWYALLLRALLQGVSKTSIRQKTVRSFMTRSRPEGLGDWAVGYMMPAKEKSLVGKHFSPQSIGHWGFTGTSVWYDPVYDISICVLSNRTLYGRENKKMNELRPALHNLIVEGLRRV